MYMSEIVGPRRRERPVLRWKDRVKESIHERVADGWGGIELARMECLDRDKWRFFCCGHSLGGHFRRERDSRNYR